VAEAIQDRERGRRRVWYGKRGAPFKEKVRPLGLHLPGGMRTKRRRLANGRKGHGGWGFFGGDEKLHGIYINPDCHPW